MRVTIHPNLPGEEKPSMLARMLPATKAILPILLVLTGLLIVFRGAFFKGLVFQEMDTQLYYYPALTELHRALQQGVLPLWTPYIYGGFPLFADGESGALYPVNLALAFLTSPGEALLWLGPISFGMATLFMFLYIRTIGLGRLGALVSALVFGFGGFSIAQLHHVNLSNGAVWLPLILLFIEKSFRREGPARIRMLLLAALALAAQGLALHVQVSLMTVFFLVLYVAFRSLAFPSEGPRRWPHRGGGSREPRLSELEGPGKPHPSEHESPGKPRLAAMGAATRRMVLALATLAGTAGLGLGLAAVQWVPLYELSRFSPRAPGLPYSQALEYSLPPLNLITLIAPYFFRGPQRISWGVWSPWETTIYVGIAPLLLAGVALLWGRSRWTAFFGGTALLSLLVAMANYLPLNLHYIVYRLPWFDALRAPGRFSYLFTFSMACLAGFGAHWLAGRREGPAPRRFLVLPFGLLAILGILLVGLQIFDAWLSANKAYAAETLGEFYLKLGPSSLSHLTKFDVIDFLRNSARSLYWAIPTSLILTSCGLLIAWRRLPRWRLACLLGLVLLISADLFWFDQAFHETIPVEKLAQASPAVEFLAQRAGSDRVVNVGSVLAEPNRLAPFLLQEAGGYSSLPFQRQRQYLAAALHLERPLLELWNARYLVAGKRPSYAYRGLSFDPATPLFGSSGKTPGSQTRFIIDGYRTQEIRLLSTMRRAADIPQDTPVGVLVLMDGSGAQLRLPLQAGVHTAEAAYDRGDVQPLLRHRKPQVAATLRDFDPSGKPYQSNIYYASIILLQAVDVRVIAIEYSHPTGSLEVETVALVGPQDRTYQVRPFHLEKYRQIYDGEDGAIFEDQSALPRAFIVERAVSLASGSAVLARLTAPDFDPLNAVLLEEPVEQGSRIESRESSDPTLSPGTAQITAYGDQRVVVEAVTDQPAFLVLSDSFYPGWRAYVDGRETRIYRADYLFRAVALPAGRHTVEFRYGPESVTLGLWISGAVAGIIVLVALVALAFRTSELKPDR